jgi:hypothetical protein
MTTGAYQRREYEVVCPMCGRTFMQRKPSGGPCLPCQQKQRWLNDERPCRKNIHGAGTTQRRDDSQDALEITARYLGLGCFTDGAFIVAFVSERSRPAWLAEGKTYQLKMDLVPYGFLYHVQSEVSA